MKALVLSGGGSRGAFQVGALQALAEYETPEYDLFCGVSVGAVNASFLAMFHDDMFRAGTIKLTDLWNELRTSKIYKRRFPFGKINGLWAPSLFNSAPFADLIKSRVDIHEITNMNHELIVGAVSTKTGEYHIFDTASKYILDAIIASAAFPLVFTPVTLGNSGSWVDGGVINATPLQAAIDRGATDIDVILTENKTPIPYNTEPKNVLELGTRVLGFMAREIFENDIALAKRDGVNLRIIRPTDHFTIDPMNFEQSGIQSMMTHGYKLVSDMLA